MEKTAEGNARTLTMLRALPPLVYVVDDDISVRESLELLIRAAGWQAESFESAQDFLRRSNSHRAQLSCS